MTPVDWPAFARRVERKRRLLARSDGHHGGLPDEYYARHTYASFRLDGWDVTEEEVRDALAHLAGGPTALRSRQSLRLRNHAAMLHHIESDVRDGSPLACDAVVRWYTGLSAGLSTTGLSQASTDRLEEAVRRINSPQLRLQAALQEIGSIHVRLLADPLVPSFNGILARLLLRYHLGRCGLPAVLFDPVADVRQTTADGMVRRLVQLLDDSYDDLLAKRR